MFLLQPQLGRMVIGMYGKISLTYAYKLEREILEMEVGMTLCNEDWLITWCKKPWKIKLRAKDVMWEQLQEQT